MFLYVAKTNLHIKSNLVYELDPTVQLKILAEKCMSFFRKAKMYTRNNPILYRYYDKNEPHTQVNFFFVPLKGALSIEGKYTFSC